MDIEPISAIGEISAASPLTATDVQIPHAVHLTPHQSALTGAKATEAESTEDLANNGDPIAEAQLYKEEQTHIPIDAQQLLPTHAEHVAGHDEAGKGALIDIYD